MGWAVSNPIQEPPPLPAPVPNGLFMLPRSASTKAGFFFSAAAFELRDKRRPFEFPGQRRRRRETGKSEDENEEPKMGRVTKTAHTDLIPAAPLSAERPGNVR